MNKCWERVSNSHDFIVVSFLFPCYDFPLKSSGCWNNKLDLSSVVYSFSFTGLSRMGFPTDSLSFVSYGDMYIYMARSQAEHRTLSFWLMGLSGCRRQYIDRETRYVGFHHSVLKYNLEQCWWLWSCVNGSIWSVLFLQCNGMFLFWTRHFAITIFIEIIKEHQLLQIVMKHLNWRNGYWLVLSCIKNMLSPVEYQVVCFLWLLMVCLSNGGIQIDMCYCDFLPLLIRWQCTCLYCPDDSFFAGLLCSFELRWKSFFQGQMRLVSCGGIYIYMAKSHTEHRALVSWPMGLSGDHWCYITREMKYAWLLFLILHYKCEQ